VETHSLTCVYADQPMAVTQVVAPSETFEMEWTPERVGNWLFHCNMVGHMSPIPEKFSMRAVRFRQGLGFGMLSVFC
jgi:hypothetical protein